MREEQLRYILEIAHTGSINKAAANLFITHQSLERSLSNFENELGIKIFNRSKKGVEITEQGRIALEKIQELVIGYDALRSIAIKNSKTSCEFSRSFTIYFSAYIRYPLANIALQKLIGAFPDVKFYAKNCREIGDRLEDGFYLMISGSEQRMQEINEEKLYFYEFFSDKSYLVASKDHPLAKYKEISMKKALQYPFVLMQPENTMQNPILAWCLENNLNMAVALETDHLATYINAICGGSVVGCWPQISLTMNELNAHKNLKIIGLKDLPYFRVFGLTNRKTYKENEDIIQFLLQIIRQNM